MNLAPRILGQGAVAQLTRTADEAIWTKVREQRQGTEDRAVVAAWLKAGQLTPRQARPHPPRRW